MTKSLKRSARTVALKLDSREGLDEGNVARLGLISVQDRIPEDFTAWTNEFVLEGRAVRLSCVAAREHGGVPHGLDNDVAMALLELFVEAGSPASGELEVGAYTILEKTGWSRSGHYYEALARSLTRLRFAAYSAQDAWFDKGLRHLSSTTFNYLEALDTLTVAREKVGEGNPLAHRTLIRVRLAAPIVRSVRNRYLKPLDTALLRSLDRSLTRAIYRLLDAQRYRVDLETAAQVFEVPLLAWGQACKLVDLRPEKIRRTLENAHSELLERGYLSEVLYLGRGQAQQVRYTFAQPGQGHTLPESAEEVPDALLARYEAVGVSRAVARGLLERYGAGRGEARLNKALALLEGFKPRNRAGFVVDVLRDDLGKYPDPEGEVGVVPSLTEKRAAGGHKAQKVRQARLERQALLEEAQRPLEARLEDVLKTVRFLCGPRLGSLEQARLRTLLLESAQPEQLAAQLSRARLEGRVESAVTQLLAQLEEGHLILDEGVLDDGA